MPGNFCCTRFHFSRETKTVTVLRLFSLLIVLDFVAFFDSLFALIYLWLPEQTKNKTDLKMSDVDQTGSQDDNLQHLAIVFGEMLCFLILLLCNSLGISGVQKKTPYLLVPWLFVYIVGILSCYVASFILFLSQFYDDSLSIAPLVPVLTGLVFHTGWTFVNSVFNDLRSEFSFG